MASILRVNTLTDASSNNSVAMATVAQGSAKTWAHLDLATENTIDDSLNVGSITDVAGGKVAVTASSAMATINYTSAGSAWNGSSDNYSRVVSPYDARTTTVVYQAITLSSDAGLVDAQDVDIVNHGDLA